MKNKIKARKNKLKSKKYSTAEKAIIKKEIEQLEKDAENLFQDQFKGYDLYIMNYEALCNEDIRMAIHKLKPQAVLSDESHYIKNHEAERSKALYEFAEAKIRIESTATPIQKDYKDIYGLFKLLKPEYWPNFSRFASLFIKYAGFGKIAGYKNIELLKEKIGPNIFVKTKEDICGQLPELLVLERYCHLDQAVCERNEEIFIELEQLKEQEKSIRAKCKSEDDVKNNKELPMIEAKIMALQTFAQELADDPRLLEMSSSEMSKQYAVKAKSNPKLKMLVNLVGEIIESGEKVAIFCRFERMQALMIEALQKAHKGLAIAHIDGSMDTKQRFVEVYDKFRDTDEYKVLLLTDAGAEGLNLSKCKYLIEYDLASSYAIQTQRHGRVERADSVHDNVVAYQFIAHDSWDEVAKKIVEKKEGYDFELIKSLRTNN